MAVGECQSSEREMGACQLEKDVLFSLATGSPKNPPPAQASDPSIPLLPLGLILVNQGEQTFPPNANIGLVFNQTHKQAWFAIKPELGTSLAISYFLSFLYFALEK